MSKPRQSPVPGATPAAPTMHPEVQKMIARYMHTFPGRDFNKSYEAVRKKLGDNLQLDQLLAKMNSHCSAIALMTLHAVSNGGPESYEFELVSDVLQHLRQAVTTAQFALSCRMRSAAAEAEAAKEKELENALDDIEEDEENEENEANDDVDPGTDSESDSESESDSNGHAKAVVAAQNATKAPADAGKKPRLRNKALLMKEHAKRRLGRT